MNCSIDLKTFTNPLFFFQGCRIPSRPMICNYSSQMISNDQPQTATIIVDDSENENDWPLLVNCLRSEKLKLAQSLHAMMAEKESLAMSLEGKFFYLFVCLFVFTYFGKKLGFWDEVIKRPSNYVYHRKSLLL